MELQAGSRLRSAVGTTEVVVVRPPDGSVTLTAGGVPMLSVTATPVVEEIKAGSEGTVLLGKRYVDEAATIEVLCTKPGEGALAVDGHPLAVKSPKPLPSSD